MWDVNAYSTKRINEYDFGRRLRAFAQADSTFREKLSKNELLIVLANYFFFLNDGDISIRNNSSSGISDLIKDLAHESQIDKQSVINETVFPFIKKFLKISDSILRKVNLNFSNLTLNIDLIVGIIEFIKHPCQTLSFSIS